MKSAIWAGESIDRFIPPQLRNVFYKNASKYARNNGIGAYDFVTNGLVLYLPLWALNNGGTNSIQSIDAFKHTCTITGALWTPKGRDLDGTDDKIALPDNACWDFGTGDATIEFVAKFDAFDTTHRYLIDMAKAADGTSRCYMAFRDNPALNTSDTVVQIGVAGSILIAGVRPSLNVWHHIMLERASATQYYYLDNVLTGTGTVGGATTNINAVDTAYIGARYGLDVNSFHNGLIGEVRIYNRALTPSEVQRNYLATAWRYR